MDTVFKRRTFAVVSILAASACATGMLLRGGLLELLIDPRGFWEASLHDADREALDLEYAKIQAVKRAMAKTRRYPSDGQRNHCEMGSR